MWRKTLKKFIYVSIPIAAFLVLFFHPRNFKSAFILDNMVRPVGLLQAPIFEIKKLFYFHETYDNYKRLKWQNEVLRGQLLNLKESMQASGQYQSFENFQATHHYPSILAHVIGRDPSNWNASLIIDKGSHQGLVVGLPVISPLGVVGRVFEVGHNTAKVILLSDPSFAVAAVIQRSRENGLLTGTLEGLCRLQYLTSHADVKVGDELVTSRLSSAFPEGILIGQVTDVQASVNTHTVECLVQPAVDLSVLEEVMVINERY